MLTDVRDQRPRVHVANAHDIVAFQVVLQCATATGSAGHRREVAHHHARHAGSGGFGLICMHAVIPDVRSRHHHNLLVVAGVCEDFLITVHPGVERNFTEAGATASGCFAMEHCPIGQDQHRNV